MRTIPSALLSHLAGDGTTLAVCWRVERRDGVLILGTQHDADIEISAAPSPSNPYAGTYVAQAAITGSNVRSTSDLSVDNLEVEGATSSDLTIVDLTAADIEAGLLDDASVVIFIVNYESPDDGQIVLRKGTIGNVTRTAEGQYRTELRGLTQALSQTIVRTYSATCDAELFDTRCKLGTAGFTTPSTVTTEHSTHPRSRFFYDSDTPLETFGQVIGGKITFTSGENAGFSMEIKDHDATNNLVFLYLPMPNDIEAGDAFTFRAGCDKTKATCHNTYNNIVNFRGHGFYVPGANEVLKVGGQ